MNSTTQRHQSGKAIIGDFWRGRDCIVHFEASGDVFARTVQEGQFVFTLSEYEQSTRNAIRNFQRNDSQARLGAKKYLVGNQFMSRARLWSFRKCTLVEAVPWCRTLRKCPASVSMSSSERVYAHVMKKPGIGVRSPLDG